MGYLRGVMHGLVIGGAVALMYAPKPGRQMRTDLSEKLDQMRGQMQPVIDQAQGCRGVRTPAGRARHFESAAAGLEDHAARRQPIGIVLCRSGQRRQRRRARPRRLNTRQRHATATDKITAWP